MIKRLISRLIIVAIFSIAFAYIESAVVVYLREIFHPNGFDFPLKVLDTADTDIRLFFTEVGREAATLVLILTACSLFGENRRQRVAYFLAIFAIWDIFYYVWLKALLDWPASIMDWDILFLIPVTWASPVLVPVIVSLTMFGFSLVILLLDTRSIHIRPGILDWMGLAAAALLMAVLFCHAGLFAAQADYYRHFNWPGFVIAELIAVCFFVRCVLKASLPSVSQTPLDAGTKPKQQDSSAANKETL
jgi:hypothetical protein